MMGQSTNYADIQQDEIQALQSIYMDDLYEEGIKTGAWNKIVDRAFRIRLNTTISQDDEIPLTLTLAVTLPATYPKTLPLLLLTFSDGVPVNIRDQAQQIIDTKPKTLVGTEMIFEIATLLQDTLDDIPQTIHEEVPTLDEERTFQEAASIRQARQVQEDEQNEQLQAHLDEEQHLSHMMEKEKARVSKRKNKAVSASDNLETEDAGPGSLSFDQPITTKSPEGSAIVIHTVYSKIKYRQGKVTQVSKVQPWPPVKDTAVFLILKECHLVGPKNEDSMKKRIQNLESKLDALKNLAPHPSVVSPLNFCIQRSTGEDGSIGEDWDVSVLMRLAEKGSMYDLLDTVVTLSVAAVRAWTIQLLEGLEFYHRNGVIHASVSLNNVLLEKAETGNTIAKLSDGGYQNDLHILRGRTHKEFLAPASVYWTAPEVGSRGQEQPLAASDIWDLGVVFLQMIFGLEIQSLYASPDALRETLKFSQSFGDLLDQLFKADFKKRMSAFELLPYEFLRNDDSVLEEHTATACFGDDISNSFPGTKSPRQRRESMHASTTSSRFANDFVEAGRLGRGGYGEVVKARNKLDGQFYAIKRIKQSSQSGLSNVLSETRLLSRLNHPNVVRYFTAWVESDGPQEEGGMSSSSIGSSSSADGLDVVFGNTSGNLDFISSSGPNIEFGYDSACEESNSEASDDTDKLPEEEESRGMDLTESSSKKADRRNPSSVEEAIRTTLYIQMEYCERQTLRDLVHGDLHQDSKECWRLFRQILEGLAHIHAASIVHRDLKPENIFIDSSKDVRIGDFGLARPGDYQAAAKAKGAEDAYNSFTKSIGTASYVAPEVRSAGSGKYNGKADMYSLGIILFEMCVLLATGMERAETLGRLHQKEPVLPVIFEEPDKTTQGHIIVSLVNHDPAQRPSSAELLRGGQVPVQIENEVIRTALRALNDPKSSFHSQFVSAIFSGVDTGLSDAAAILKRHDYDTAAMSNSTVDDLLLQSMVKEQLTSIFACHGAVEVHRQLLLPYSSASPNYSNSAVKLIDSSGTLVQLPYDLTLPYARILAKHPNPGRKTFAFADVYRQGYPGGHPRTHGEVDFDLVSYDSLDLALREAEVMKVIDEVIDAFPSMVSVQMCYHLNHSKLLDAILAFCDIDQSKWSSVKEIISRLNIGQWTWAKIRNELRAPSIAIAATSLEELVRFDFRDTVDEAIPKIRSILPSSADLGLAFLHLEAVTVYLARFNVKRKIYINPLSSHNEKFYRGNLLFQCIYDNRKRDVFAAGGRYDKLVQDHQPTSTKDSRHAVGFNLNWQGLCTSMARYQKALVNSKSKKRVSHEFDTFWNPRRCDILVDSFDSELLRSTGVEIVQELWANKISAELALDTDPQAGADYQATRESKDIHTWIVMIKDGSTKVRCVARKEDYELRQSDLVGWFRSEIRDRDRAEGRAHDKVRLLRQSSQQDTSAFSTEHDANVKILTSKTKGKKMNRTTVIEEAQSRAQELVRSTFDSPIAAIETKDEVFEGIRGTSLSDPDSWKKFIQHAPAGERQYLVDLQELLNSMARETKAGNRTAFIYNFRTRACMSYDLGRPS